MKIRLSKTPLRRDWQNHPAAKGLLLEKDINIGGASRLRAKLLVFQSCPDLRRFWKSINPSDLGNLCRGAVNGLHHEIHGYPKGKPEYTFTEVDPRYYCIIGLVKNYLTMEIICHESIHAAFNYTKRRTRNFWDEQTEHFHEEGVAYPAGRIASEINRVLWKAGLAK